jgi:S-methylmethionine-dependent homocysteine/selenocysteine methylase
VAGSMPPLFGSYEPTGFDPVRGAPIYESIARALEPHVDLWIGETLSTIAEMSVIVGAINAAGSTKPVWMSFSLPDEWADERVAIRSGESPRDIATAATAFDDRIAALLFNCSLPEQTGPALIELRAALNGLGSPARVGAYANAFPTTRGDTYQANEVIFERRNELTPERYSEFAEEWIRDGATIVGGCCDMYPEHIHGLAQRFA